MPKKSCRREAKRRGKPATAARQVGETRIRGAVYQAPRDPNVMTAPRASEARGAFFFSIRKFFATI